MARFEAIDLGMNLAGIDMGLSIEGRRANWRCNEIVELPLKLFDEVDELRLLKQREVLIPKRSRKICA